MAAHRLIATPVCPVTLPGANGCIVGVDNYNAIVASQEFHNNTGIQVWSANSRRINGTVQPVAGHSGNAFFENNPTDVQTYTDQIPLYTGYNRFDLFIFLKLTTEFPGPMYQQVKIDLFNGSNSIELCNFYSGFATGTGVNIGAIAQYKAMTGVLPAGIVPTFVTQGPNVYSQVAPGSIQVTVRKYNGRGSVTGNGSGYWDGLLNAQLWLWRDC